MASQSGTRDQPKRKSNPGIAKDAKKTHWAQRMMVCCSLIFHYVRKRPSINWVSRFRKKTEVIGTGTNKMAIKSQACQYRGEPAGMKSIIATKMTAMRLRRMSRVLRLRGVAIG